MATEFTISPSLKGYVYETDFVFTRTNLFSYNTTTWDFGDGTVIYNTSGNSVTHSYKYPGTYKVGLSAWSQAGDFDYKEQFVEVDYKIRDAIEFTQLPTKWSIIGQKTNTPYVISLTSTNLTEPIAVVLHSTGSRSVPYTTLIDKWRFLVPTWRFVDAETDEVIKTSLKLTTTPIKASNGKTIAVTASAAFYYIDCNTTITNSENRPIILTATLSTENFQYPLESQIYPYYSYSNTDAVKAAAFCHVYDVLPNELKVTENYIQDIYPIKWTTAPIPVLANFRFNPANAIGLNFGSDVSAVDIFNYPKTNAQGLLSQLILELSGVNKSSFTQELSPIYFRNTEENNTLASGYLFTSLSCSIPISSTKVIARTSVYPQPQLNTKQFSFPEGYPLNYYAYVSHPYENNINVIEYNTFDLQNNYPEYYKSKGMLLEGKLSTIDVPKTTTNSTNNLTISEIGGVYALAYNPLEKTLYAADSDNNRIFMYVEDKLTKTLSLSSAVWQIFGSVPSLSSGLSALPISPSSLSIDKNGSVWIALFDASLVLKYDKGLNSLITYATPMTDLSALYNNIEESTSSPYITPATVKTDRNNGIWVSYANPLSSTIFKYTQFGGVQFLSAFPPHTTPVDIAITKENNAWIACRDANKVLCYSLSGTLLSSIEVLKPSYISIDRQNNLWVLHGYNFISKYDTHSYTMSSWKVTNSPVFNYELKYNSWRPIEQYSTLELKEAYDQNEIWGGLAVDVLNRVWAVNSEINSTVVVPAEQPDKLKNIALIPKGFTNYYITSAGLMAQQVSATNVRSAQAVGDWTGNEWYQKYGETYADRVVVGESSPFQIIDINKGPSVAKINEDFSYAQYFKNLALPELLGQNKTLFDNFIAATVGTANLTEEEIGRVLYEKIANFVLNHSDIETAEIPQLLSIMESLKHDNLKSYGADYPVEVQRLLNLFSVTLHRLRGIPQLDPDVNNNVGGLLTGSSMVSAGQYIYTYDKRYDTYQIFQLGVVNNQNTYPLSAAEFEGLRDDSLFTTTFNEVPASLVQTLKNEGVQIYEGEKINKEPGKFYRKILGLESNYRFFEFNPEVSVGYQSNLIDWNNPYTTLSYTTSSYEDYYKENGIVELYFNNLLTKRLFGK